MRKKQINITERYNNISDFLFLILLLIFIFLLLKSFVSFGLKTTYNMSPSYIEMLQNGIIPRKPLVHNSAPCAYAGPFTRLYELTGGMISIDSATYNGTGKFKGIEPKDLLNELSLGFSPQRNDLVGANIASILFEVRAAGLSTIKTSGIHSSVLNYINGCRISMGENVISVDLHKTIKISDDLINALAKSR